MSNNKDFKVKNGIQPTSYFEGVGTAVSGSVEYNISSTSYDSKSFSVASQEATPRSVFFKPDGSKLYLVGSTSDTVYQYTLSTAWDVSTASYDSKSFSVVSQDLNPYSIFFKPDGTKFYMQGASNDDVYQYSLSTAWDISTASYDSVSFDGSTQDTALYGVFFKEDGTKMYLNGYANGGDVYQYSLSTAWDLSTASYDSVSFDYSAQASSSVGLYFSDDGSFFFLLSDNTDIVYKYTLTTSWDISTATYDSSSPVFAQDTSIVGFSLGNSGTKLYMLGNTNDTIYQYSTVLTTATLDLSTGSVFEITPTSDIQVTLSNPADSGTVSGATLLLSAVGTEYTITYDPAIEWSSGTAPTSPAIGETDVITFNTRDGGTTYSAALAIDGAQ